MAPFRLVPLASALLVLAACGSERAAPAPSTYALPSGEVVKAKDSALDPTLQVGRFDQVDGTRTLLATVRTASPSYSRRSARSESAGGEVNRLFYDLDTRQTRALFETNAQRILNVEVLGLQPGSGEPGGVRAFLYRTVRQDTDGNGELGGGDEVSLGLSAADGSGYMVLATGVEAPLGTFWVDADRAVVWYQLEGRVEGVEIDVAKPALLHRATLALPPAGTAAETL